MSNELYQSTNIKKNIIKKDNGLLFPQQNRRVLPLKIKWVLEHPKKAKAMAKKGKVKVILDTSGVLLWIVSSKHYLSFN